MSTEVEIFKGDSAVLKVLVTLNGVPVNIAGFSMRFLVKKNVLDGDAAALIEKTVAGGIVLTDPTNGKAEITLVPANTLSLGPTELVYAIKIKDGSGKIYTILEGPFTIFPVAVQIL